MVIEEGLHCVASVCLVQQIEMLCLIFVLQVAMETKEMSCKEKEKKIAIIYTIENFEKQSSWEPDYH